MALFYTYPDYTPSYGRLSGIEQKNSTGIIASSLYGFDNLNRLTSETIDGVNRLIDYDKTDQVKTVTGSNNEAYTYDLNGNRTNGGYVTGANNQLLSDGTYNYQYDAEGNRTKRTNIATNVVDEYVWDYRNRLTTVTTKDSGGVVTQTVGYEYDVDDQRVSKTVNGVVEKYIIDRNQIAYVTDASGTQTFHYLYGTNVDAVMAQDSPTGMVWSLTDRLGSVNLLADAGGAVVDQRTFDSFGRVLSETNPSVKFRYGYTGRETDGETGLDYYRARYYDAANGRFISVDPAGFGAGDTNLYRYVGNSSTMYTDPSGENPLLIGVAIAVGIGLLADLVYPNLVQAPTTKNDIKELPPGYDGQKFVFETVLGFGVDSAVPLAKAGLSGLEHLADSAVPLAKAGISEINRLLGMSGRDLGTIPVPVNGVLENIGNKAANSWNELFQHGTQTAGVAANHASELFQHYLASSTSENIPNEVASGGSIFRGDKQYKTGPIGHPIGSENWENAIVTTPWEHVAQKIKGHSSEISRFTSFTELLAKTRKFTNSDRDAIKILQKELSNLEEDGIIKMYTPEKVRSMMIESGNKKLKKDANNIYKMMNDNKEILIEGQIPANLIERVK